MNGMIGQDTGDVLCVPSQLETIMFDIAMEEKIMCLGEDLDNPIFDNNEDFDIIISSLDYEYENGD
jgi:hypothetical protein